MLRSDVVIGGAKFLVDELIDMVFSDIPITEHIISSLQVWRVGNWGNMIDAKSINSIQGQS